MHKRKALNSTHGLKIVSADAGEFEAVFAELNVKDYDGDVTFKGAFEQGAEVRISAYNHKSWEGALPVGKGTIEERGDLVVCKGRFFLDTEAGRETFIVVKELGPLQEWSYGYDTLEEERGNWKGQTANLIKKQKVYEVSPVILGAGLGTRTTSIKSRYVEADAEHKQLYSEFAEQLRSAGREQFKANKERYVWVEDFDMDADWVIYRVCDEIGAADGDKLVKMSYTRKDDDVELTGDEQPVEVTYVAASDTEGGAASSNGEAETKKKDTEPGMKDKERDSDNEIDAEVTGTKTHTMTAEEKGLPAGSKLTTFTGSMKQLYSDIYWTLNELGKERFRRHMYVEIYDVDVDADWVIFRCREEGDACLIKISFQRNSDGEIELSEEEEEVEIEQSFVAAKDRSGEHGEKKATPFYKTGTTDDAWSGPAMIKAMGNDAGADTFKKMFAWVDPKGDASKKVSYHFPHHMVDEDGKVGDANVKACTLIIGILNGARGGTAIPEADRQGVYNHVAQHIKDAGKTPPALKATSEEKRSSEQTGLKFSEHVEAVMAEIDELSERVSSVVTLRTEKGKKHLGDESNALLKELTGRMADLQSFLEDSAEADTKSNTNDAELSPVDRAYLDHIAASHSL